MIPRTKEAIKDYIYAGAFVAAGVLMPNSVVDTGFEAHISGLAIGAGIGWLIKSVIAHAKKGKD
jgi:membrane associated rhomboid family serine protease